MLYEMAYPGLLVLEGMRRLLRKRKRGARRPVAFRAIKCRLRRREIALVETLSPHLAARIALSRFEAVRSASDHIAMHRMVGLTDRTIGKGNGFRILLVHGWNADSDMMLPLAHGLSRYGVQSIVPDLPGEGRNRPCKLTFVQKAQHIANHYRDQTPFDAVVGHSAGGLIAGLAIEAGLRTQRMVTVSAPYSIETLLHVYLFRVQAPVSLQQAITTYYHDREGRDPARIGPTVYAAFNDRLLVAHARSDWQVRLSEAEDICAVAPQAGKLILDHCNHHTILANPRLHEAISAFVSGAGARSDMHVVCA